jgi:hypothetical protein
VAAAAEAEGLLEKAEAEAVVASYRAGMVRVRVRVS